MSQEILKGIEHIELPHMLLEIDPDDFIIEEDELAGKKLAIYLVQKFYKKVTADMEKFNKISRKQQDQALVYAKYYASKKAIELPDVIASATGWLFKDANETGWFNDLPGEFQTLSEFLSTFLDGVEENSSSFYDWDFIITQLLPFAQTMGIDPGLVFGASNHVRKLRALVPAAREITNAVNNHDMSQKKGKRLIEDFLKDCADPTLASKDFVNRVDEYRGIERALPEIPGAFIVTGRDQYIITIEVDSKRRLKQIENALRHKVSFTFKDISYILRWIFPDKEPSKIEQSYQKLKDMLRR